MLTLTTQYDTYGVVSSSKCLLILAQEPPWDILDTVTEHTPFPSRVFHLVDKTDT